MVYNGNNVKENKQEYIDWCKKLATEMEGKQEDPKEHTIFPNSSDGDIATIKDLIGSFLAVLTDTPVTIR